MSCSPSEEYIERILLEDSSDPQLARDFIVMYNNGNKTCEILCRHPYNEATDKVLREYYDHMVANNGYVLHYKNWMRGFTVAKFNRRTAELMGRPELADASVLKWMTARDSICGVKEMALLNKPIKEEEQPEPCKK